MVIVENKRFEGVKEMKRLGTCQLQTRRLDLRKFKVSDADMVYHNWTSDPEVLDMLLGLFIKMSTQRNEF